MIFLRRKVLIVSCLIAIVGMENFALAALAEPVFIYKRIFKESCAGVH